MSSVSCIIIETDLMSLEMFLTRNCVLVLFQMKKVD
jgi:hypothetical protein